MEKQRIYYVYVLSDPRTNLPFYVGKGCHNRVEQHEIEARYNNESKKCQLINELVSLGLEPIKEIFSNNLTEKEAFDHEDICIEYHKKLGKKLGYELMNIQSGHKSIYTLPNKEFEDTVNKNQKEKLDYMDNDYILFLKPSQTFNYNEDETTKYNKIRQWWNLNKNKVGKIEYILVINNDVVQYVYKPIYWEFFTKKITTKNNKIQNRRRYRFCGELIKDSCYLNKVIDKNIFGHGQVVAYNFK